MVRLYTVHYTVDNNGVERTWSKQVYAISPNAAEDTVVTNRICGYADIDHTEEA